MLAKRRHRRCTLDARVIGLSRDCGKHPVAVWVTMAAAIRDDKTWTARAASMSMKDMFADGLPLSDTAAGGAYNPASISITHTRLPIEISIQISRCGGAHHQMHLGRQHTTSQQRRYAIENVGRERAEQP